MVPLYLPVVTSEARNATLKQLSNLPRICGHTLMPGSATKVDRKTKIVFNDVAEQPRTPERVAWKFLPWLRMGVPI